MMDFFINIIAFFILLKIAVYVIIFQRLIGVTLQYPAYRIKENQTIPDYLQTLFQETIEKFQSLQFEFCHYLDIDNIVAGKPQDGILLYHPQYQSYLTVSVAFPPNKQAPINLVCYTFFQDNSCLMTMNGEGDSLIGTMPNTILENVYTVTLEQQWESHLHKLQQLAKPVQSCLPDVFIEKLQAHLKQYIDALVSLKQLIKQDSQYFYVAVNQALKTAVKIMQCSSKKAKLSKKQAKHIDNKNYVFPVELEEIAFQRLKKTKEIKPRASVQQSIFALSLLAFIVVGYYLWDIQYAIIIAIVIFLHELGHFLAMKYYGYRDTSIFFLPLFGAATIGKKDNTSLTEEIIVLLAGPIPGLLLGLVCLFYMPQLNLFSIKNGAALPLGISSYQLINIGRDFTYALLIINWINLLPIYPLDGGKVINMLLFNRHPYLDFFVKVVTVLLLLALSRFDNLFLVLGIVTALTIWPTLRQAKLLKYIKGQTFAREDFYQMAFAAINALGYEKLNFEKKFELISQLEKSYYQPAIKWWHKAALIFIYILFLLGSLVTMAFIFRFKILAGV